MAAAKKHKLYKICKELNVGHETIIGFLEQKKIKVSGPNSSVPHELYEEIIERFATEKAKVEKRRAQVEIQESPIGDVETGDSGDSTNAPSEYMMAIRKSIEDKAEELSIPEIEPQMEPETVVEAPSEVDEVKPEPPQPLPVEKSQPVESDDLGESAVTEQKPEPAVEEEKPHVAPAPTRHKKGKAVSKPATPDFIPGEKRSDVPGVIKTIPAERLKGYPPRHSSKAKKKNEAVKEESVSEKELKRKKALEMIRKDSKGKVAKKRVALPGQDAPTGRSHRKKHRKNKRKEVDLKEVQDNVKKTLASLDTKVRKPKYRKKVREVEGEMIEEKIIDVTEFISANDLAELMDVPVSEILTKCMELGLMVSINQRLDLDSITLIAEEYDYKVEEHKISEFVDDEEEDEEDAPESLKPRSPIVTIMGHVDHGKTSLLDYLRKSHITSGESGGITQHIGAYEVDYQGKKITFIDTPGHAAFTAMRARGAQVTDIVILVIAADDAVMPQTDEAIDHAKAAGVKIVIAVNKIDKPGAQPEKIYQQLAERNLLVESWSGTVQSAEISAKTGQNISTLLEKVLLEAEMLDLKANPDRYASGFVVESRLDKGRGAIATVLIQSGTLHVGDNFVAGQYNGKVRAIFNERDQKLKDVLPGQPALVVGFDGVPQAGDKFIVKKDERMVREIANRRQQLKREQDAKKHHHQTLAQISEQIKMGIVSDLNILVKADVDGSAEALADALIKLNTNEVRVNIIRKAVGPISESDVLLASASNAFILGFHVRANAKAKELALKEGVDINLYQVVYDAINDIRLALEGMLKPKEDESVLGQIEVRDTFKISKIGTIAGGYVLSGKIHRNNKIRVLRDDEEIFAGAISSLKRFKDDVKEVASGFECGIQIDNYNDLKVGDIIEAFEIVKTKRTLESS